MYGNTSPAEQPGRSEHEQQLDIRLAEWYDRSEAYTDDIELIHRLIGDRGPLRILEPFCGTGRILIPLAQAGHEMLGMDLSRSMLDRLRAKASELPEETQQRITLIQTDVTVCDWPQGFDVVILGGNCFYELDGPDKQEGCIASAAASLNPGGYVYLDNNHMEGELAESWRNLGVVSKSYPSGVFEDGLRLDSTSETIWFDSPKRLWRTHRVMKATYPDGTVITKEHVRQTHPVSVVEQKEWLERNGFILDHLFGDRAGAPYTDDSSRGIFWAGKP